MTSIGKRFAPTAFVVAVLVACLTAAFVAVSAPAKADAHTVVVSTQQKVQVATAKKAAKAAKYDIVYKLNGGKQAKKQVVKVKAGATVSVSKLKKPKRSGYLFMGWYSNKKLTKQAVAVRGAVAKSKRTVYAKWVKIKTYTIKYNLNGGKLYGKYVTKFKNNKAVNSLPEPVRLDYRFDGWYSDKGLINKVTKIARGVTRNPSVYAKWIPIEYSIVYDANGGVMPSGFVNSYSADTPATVELPIPAKPGYSFMGWYSDYNMTRLVSSIPGTSRGNMLLHAKWRKRVLVAHRGLATRDPENSISAFKAASVHGFTEVETDVRYTSDGVPVLIHEDVVYVLEPVEDGEPGAVDKIEKEVSELTYEQLQTATFDEESIRSGEDGRNLATFEEAMAACSEMGLDVTIHLKTEDMAGLETLIKLVDEYEMEDHVRWFTSELPVLAYVKQVKPTARFVYSHDLNQKGVEEAAELAEGGADVEVNITHAKITASKLKLFKAKGIAIRTWGYDNETQLSKLDQYVSTVLIDRLVADRVPDPVVY